MKTTAGLCLVTALVFSAGGTDDAKKEMAKFKGTWSVNGLTYNGKEHDKLKFTITFKDDVGIVEGNDAVKAEYARIKFKLDTTTKPKCFDISVASGVQKDAAMEGIYEFKEGELRICTKVFGKDRPTEFASPDGSSIVLMVLKRENQ